MGIIITIIDYDAGNLRNVQKAVEFLGYSANISNLKNDIKNSDALILPGVGSFKHGIDTLRKLDLVDSIRYEVLENKKPILGICLGMQLFADYGTEGGHNEGLELLRLSINKLDADKFGLRIPHMGWNSVKVNPAARLFADVNPLADFYFVHSFHAVPNDENLVPTLCTYGHEFVAAVEHENIFATQFHPEKSQRYGLQVLSNFLNYCSNQT